MKRTSALFFALVIGLGGLTSCGQNESTSTLSEEWNPINDPLNMSSSYERHVNDLPLRGAVTRMPWTDTYWPSVNGGLANRWRQPGSYAFNYQLFGFNELQRADQNFIAQLSPAEKFDLLTGQYNYPLVQHERNRTRNSTESWEGLCHGWAPAAALFEEPNPVVMTNPQGIQIPFGSSDVKALLTLYQGNFSNAPQVLLGARCNADLSTNPGAARTPECRDTNAGSFHIVLTNQVGLKQESFIIDATRGAEVWNQPVSSYTSKVLRVQAPSPGAAPGTQQEALFETKLSYVAEVDAAWNALNGTSGHKVVTVTYYYRLELDQGNNIIGGEWESEARPDFIWIQQKPNFTGDFAPLKDLYEASIRR